MSKKCVLIIVFLLTGFFQILEASYSFRVVVKYPFLTEHYAEDSLGNVVIVSDSFARFIPIKAIIFSQESDSLSQESVTNDPGYASFTFEHLKYSDIDFRKTPGEIVLPMTVYQVFG